MERFCVKYVRSVNEKCGILQGFIHCIHTLSRTPGSQSGSVLRGWILVAEQAVGRLVLLDFWEAADWGIEAIVGVVVHCDGRTYTVPAGTQVRLTPGESIHIQQELYRFCHRSGRSHRICGQWTRRVGCYKRG